MAESVKKRTNRNPSTRYNSNYDDLSPYAAPSNKSKRINKQASEELEKRQLAILLKKFFDSANKSFRQSDRNKEIQMQVQVQIKAQTPKIPANNQKPNEKINQQKPSISPILQHSLQVRKPRQRLYSNPTRLNSRNKIPSTMSQQSTESKPAHKNSLQEAKRIKQSYDQKHTIESARKSSRQQQKRVFEVTKTPNKNIKKPIISLDQFVSAVNNYSVKYNNQIPQKMLESGLNTNTNTNTYNNTNANIDTDNTDNRLFKRASWHIGIAYKIHIAQIRQKYPFFTRQQIEPTTAARQWKQRLAKQKQMKQKQMQQKQMQQQIQQQQINKKQKLFKQQTKFMQIQEVLLRQYDNKNGNINNVNNVNINNSNNNNNNNNNNVMNNTNNTINNANKNNNNVSNNNNSTNNTTNNINTNTNTNMNTKTNINTNNTNNTNTNVNVNVNIATNTRSTRNTRSNSKSGKKQKK